MRVIKFRGKDIKTGEWVYGDLHTMCDKPHIHTEPAPYPYAGRRSFVNPKTIGQFTGFIRKDKDGNNVEVYEGDIVHVYGGTINYDYYSDVRWDEQGGCWYLRDELGLFVTFGLLNKDFITVIGNMFDNSDYLYK
jgi:hypothetical protein